jgi:BirA family biotin operon repressor/biotin-[acetyl-CoA-carboxylase] ligase
MAAVAVNRAIRDVAGISCGIKWPNDILCNGRKLVGILTEMSAEMDAINHIVIGVGINVNIDAGEIPPELQGIATSLSMEAGVPISRIALFIRVLERLEELYLLVRASGFAEVLAAWRQESITLGRWVNVIAPDKSFVGMAVDIDCDGALLVETDEGVERVLAGDVSIRPMLQGKEFSRGI